MSRWFHGDDLAHERARSKEFDAISAGHQYGLAPDVSLEIWARVRDEVTRAGGKHDEPGARKRFDEVAARVAAQGGELRPGPGKQTLIDADRRVAARAGRLRPHPGSGTLVESEVHGKTQERDVLAEVAPGRDTEVLVDARRWERRMSTLEPMPSAVDTTGRRELDALPAGLSSDARRQLATTPDGPDAEDAASNRRGRSDRFGGIRGFGPVATPSPVTGAVPTRADREAGARGTDTVEFADSRARGRLEVVNAVRRSADTANLSTAFLVSTPQTALWCVAERRAATLYRRAVDTSAVMASDPAVETALARVGSGQVLPTGVRHDMERELGISLAGVRIHTDAIAAEAARAVRAEAFTVGEDIYFAAGAFAPDTHRGKQLLAHELTHVAQAQRGRTSRPGHELRVSQPSEALEREADDVAARIGDPVAATSPTQPQVGEPAGTSPPAASSHLGEPSAVARRAATPSSPAADGAKLRVEDQARPRTSTNGQPRAPQTAAAPRSTTPVAPMVADAFAAKPLQGPVVMRWADGSTPGGEAVESALRPAGGEPLPAALRARFEREFGCDLSAVRLHRDGAAHAAAQALRARAFTIGEHVFFLGDTPALDSPDGRALLAHELAHVVQHYQGRIALRPGFAVSRPDDPLEREAEAVGAAVARGGETTPARALMGTSTATVGGDAPAPGSAAGPDGSGLSAPSAPSLTGFRDPAPSGGADARTGKLPGRPPSTDALIGHVPPAVPPGGKPPAAPSSKPAKHAKPAAAVKPARHGAPRAPAPPPAHRPTPMVTHPPAADTAPQLYPAPTATGSDGAAPAPRRPEGPPASAADRAAARQAAVAAEQELAAHGAALAAQARAAGQQVLAMIATDGEQQRRHVTAAAQTARQEIEPSIAAQRTAITARATAEKARTAAAVATQRAAVHAAAQAQREQASAQIMAKRQAAQAAAQRTKQGITQAGEVQAQRATAQTMLRVQRAQAIASGAGAAGDAERANAQREAATKISARAVEGVQANGRELVQAAHETAAALAAEVDGKLADYNHSLEQCATENEEHITKLETDAASELDTMGHQAEQSITALATEALSALDGHKAELLVSIEQSLSWSTAHIGQSVAAVHAQAATQIEEQCGQLTAAGRAARVVFEGVQRVDQVATVAAEARGQLDQAGAGVGQAIQGLHSATQRELTSAGQAAATAMTAAGSRGAAEAGTAGATLLEKLATVATGATTSINARGNKAQATLVAGGQTFAQQLTQAHGQFTDKLGGLVALATHTISEKVDAGLAYQDQWVDKARRDAASTAQQIGSRYDALKAQADARNASGAQRSWLSDAWDTVTGWIDSVRQWFLRTFGDFWGGLLFGILSALVIVAIGLAIGWAVGAIVGAFIASATVAAIVTAVILIGGAIAISVYARFQEFYADNPGQSAGFWRGLGLVGLGIADLTGIPYMIEGIVGQRAFGAKMNTAQRTERFGMGVVFLVTFGLATWKGVKWFRGRAPAAPVDPHAPPAADPHGPPGPAPDPNTPAHDPNAPAHDPNAPAHDPNAPAQDPDKPSAPASRELGLSKRATDALASLENIKEDPVGDVNSDPAHNHYAAARREAAGEVVARKANGTPFDHIQDLQQAYRGLENVRAALEAEMRNPPDTMTERGLQVLLDKYSELQGIMSRLKGFLNSIGQGNFPPFHQWPPGS